MPSKDKEKIKAYQREYYQKNSAKVSARTQAWRRANPEKFKTCASYVNAAERVKEWKKNNKERAARHSAEYTRNHPERNVAKEHKRRAAKALSGGSYTSLEWALKVVEYGYVCAYSGTECATACNVTGPFEVDHVIPLSAGGSNLISNIVPACPSCNRRKHAKLWTPRRPVQN